jgi:CAP-Gly domain-containing linker protein 1
MEKRHSEVLAEFEFECERLQNKVDAAEELADDRQRTLIELEGQQSLAIDSFRRSAETEKRQLEKKLDELEIRVRESIANANSRRYEQQIEGKDNYEQQIEFLNSVIVDMQKKNDELKSRVQVLEEIGLGEFDSSFQSSVRMNGHIRTPRVFCDICDVFDEHETEDCPKQESLDQEVRTHSSYHAIRTERRPYCDVCEMFGHSISDCPQNNETF